MAGTITATSQCQDGTEAHNNPSIGSDVRELDLTSSRADYSPQVGLATAMGQIVASCHNTRANRGGGANSTRSPIPGNQHTRAAKRTASHTFDLSNEQH